MKKTVKIEGMSCSHCSSRVEKALRALGLTVTVSLEEKCAVVEGDKTDAEIRDAVEALGFDVVSIA